MLDLDERIEKLPKWARDHIHNLTRQRDHARARVNAPDVDPTAAKVITDPYAEVPKVLADDVKIQFKLPVLGVEHARDTYIQVGYVFDHALNTNVLRIRGGEGVLTLRPESSNTMTVEVRDYKRGA
jgi:hypothetical protein